MTSFSVAANKIFVLQSLPVSLLLFEIAYVRAASSVSSPDELNVPYVPYVVVDKNKDEFDYERLQDTIVKYLENRPQQRPSPQYNSETSTSFYDYLQTSPGPSASVADDRDRDRDHDHQRSSITDLGNYASGNRHSLQHHHHHHHQQQQQQQPESTSFTASSGPNVHHQSPPHVADTRSMNVYPFGVSDIHPAYHSSVFKPGAKIKDSSEVTANVKVTTFLPHRYVSTPLNTFPQPNVSSARHRPSDTTWYPSAILETATPKFVPLKTSFVPSPFADTIGSESRDKNVDYGASFSKFAPLGEKKCSLRSSRYVYDGGCVSKKPVVETVCADRCIKYEALDGTEKPFHVDVPYKMERQTSAMEKKKKAIALTCTDGDVKKQKIKLYCKDGTILNNVIRIVSNCICQEHSEKVHTTKRSHHKYVNSRVRMMGRPPVNVRLRV